jgi:hypothetical protein
VEDSSLFPALRREGRRHAAARQPAISPSSVIAGGHASDIAPKIFVAFSGGAQRRIEVRTQRAGNEREHSCIDAGRLAAHEERFGPKKIRNRVDRSRTEREDLGSCVPAHALSVERALELSPDEGDHEWANRRRDFSEEIFRTLGEVDVIDPARIDERPIEVVLRHLFECPSDGALLRQQSLVEIHAVFVFQMPADERRVGNPFAVIIDVRQLALWRPAEPGGVGSVSKAGRFQQHFSLGDERARVRQTEGRPE